MKCHEQPSMKATFCWCLPECISATSSPTPVSTYETDHETCFPNLPGIVISEKKNFWRITLPVYAQGGVFGRINLLFLNQAIDIWLFSRQCLQFLLTLGVPLFFQSWYEHRTLSDHLTKLTKTPLSVPLFFQSWYEHRTLSDHLTKLTKTPLKITFSNRNLLFHGAYFQVHASFRGCVWEWHTCLHTWFQFDMTLLIGWYNKGIYIYIHISYIYIYIYHIPIYLKSSFSQGNRKTFKKKGQKKRNRLPPAALGLDQTLRRPSLVTQTSRSFFSSTSLERMDVTGVTSCCWANDRLSIP